MKKKQWKSVLTLTGKTSALVLAAMVLTVPAARAEHPPEVFDPDHKAQGKTLTEWLSVYWQWWAGGSDPAEGKIGKVQLMPLPDGDVLWGDFSPEDPGLLSGHLHITLPARTPFVLPLFAWVGERYEGWPEVEDDPLVEDSFFLPGVDDDGNLIGNVIPELTIDGVKVITIENMEDFYIPYTPFEPVFYDEPTDYGSVASVSFQGVGFVGKPLSPGEHTIHLVERWIWPGEPDELRFGQVFDNTWHVTVKERPRRHRGRRAGWWWWW